MADRFPARAGNPSDSNDPQIPQSRNRATRRYSERLCISALSAPHAGGTLLRALYYTAIIEDQEFSSIRPLVDWLDYNGYTVVTKATKEFIDSSGRRKIKANMNIELTVDAMELAGKIDEMVLFSGDGDFRSLVAAVQRRGVRVTVVSTIGTQPPMIADELRRQADVFTDLLELQSKVGRDPSERQRERSDPRREYAQRPTPPRSRGQTNEVEP
jgi:uncharacterized LabA/DUF88 family protein